MTSSSRPRAGRHLRYAFAIAGAASCLWSSTIAAAASPTSSSEASTSSSSEQSARELRLGVEVGIQQLDEDLYMPVRPTFSASFPLPAIQCPEHGESDCRTPLRVGVQVPLRLRVADRAPEESGLLRDEDWDEFDDYLRIVRFVEYGRPSEVAHLRLGELGAVVLGHGTIVNGYYNVVTPDHYQLGLQASTNTTYGGGTLLVDNLVSPSVVGGRGYVRPWSFFDRSSWGTRLAIGASLVGDVDAPLRLARRDDRSPLVGPSRRPDVEESRGTAIGGLDLELNLLDRDVASLTPYTDLNHHFGLGTGWHTGVLTALRPVEGLELSNRLEFRMLGEGYLPDYIGPLYEIHRYQLPGWGQLLPAPKLRVAADPTRGRLLGGYGELTAELFGYAMLSGGYANYQGPDNGSLRLQLRLTPTERFQVGMFYYKRHLESLTEIVERPGTLMVAEGRIGVVGPLYVKSTYSLLWHLKDDGLYEPVRRWGVGAGASVGF